MSGAPMILIGIDPGFASMGICEVHITAGSETLHAVSVARTKKATKKRQLLVAEDDTDRAQHLAQALRFAIEDAQRRGTVVAICCEAQSGSKGARAARTLGIAIGIVATAAHFYGLPVIQASPQAVKKAMTGAGTAAKESVEAAVIRRFPNHDDLRPRNKSVAGSPREHAADAVAVVIACLPHPTIQAVRRMMGHTYGGSNA